MARLNLNDSKMVQQYEQFIKENGNFFQSLNWAKVKSNWEPFPLYVQDESGNITAAMSIIGISNDNEHMFLYAPRGPIGDLNDTETMNKLFSEVDDLAKETNAYVVSFDPELPYSPQLIDSIKQINFKDVEIYNSHSEKYKFINPNYNMIADISPFKTADEYLASLKSKFRFKINKAYKVQDTKVERYTINDPDFDEKLSIYDKLSKETAKRHGITSRPKDYFKRLFENFEDVVLYLVSDDEEVLSGSICLNYGKKSFYLYGASTENKREKLPNNKMNFEAIRDAIDKGYKQYDMGGLYALDNSDKLYVYKKMFTSEAGATDYVGLIEVVCNREVYDKHNHYQIKEQS